MANGFLKRKLGLKDVAPLVAWFGGIGSILPLIPIHFWVFSLTDHFRMHYILVSVLAMVFSWWFKQLKYSMTLLSLVGLNFYLISPWNWEKPILPRAQENFRSRTHSLIWMNVHTSNESKKEVVDYLLQKNVDLILVSEVNHRWIQSLEVLKMKWPYQILHPREDNFGMAVYSKFEFDSYSKLKLEAFDVPAIEMNLRSKDGNSFTILAVHPVPPIGKVYTQSRDTYLSNLSRHMMVKKQPSIVIGDFNATPWHHPVRRLMNENELRYCSPASYLLPSTWPSAVSGVGIPIDLCLVGRPIQVLRHLVGPSLGSDHRLLELQFAVE